MTAHWVRACALVAFEERQIVGVTLEGLHLVVIQDGDRCFAVERACPHEGADLAHGRCSDARLHCPRHLASFDLQSGAVSPGWSFRALHVYQTRITGDDLWVNLVRR